LPLANLPGQRNATTSYWIDETDKKAWSRAEQDADALQPLHPNPIHTNDTSNNTSNITNIDIVFHITIVPLSKSANLYQSQFKTYRQHKARTDPRSPHAGLSSAW
jgi:hypothetical protein